MGDELQRSEFLVIGVDGGATEAKAHEVRRDRLNDPGTFHLGASAASRTYPRRFDFIATPEDEQVAQHRADRIRLSDIERLQGQMWVQCACEAVAEVVAAAAGSTECRVLIGVGMPGLKTADGRGIGVINNGPRIPDYLDAFERGLTRMGVQLAAPVTGIASDADCCGLGELFAGDGLFRDVRHAYYVGCGTGIADAMKLNGRLVTFDEARTWIHKSWQIRSSLGPTFEKLVSARAMNHGYRRLLGHDPPPGERFPEVDAANGCQTAMGWMDNVARLLSELVFERLTTVKNGRSNLADRSEAYRQLDPAHPFRGTLLERVVVGQRLGLILADRRFDGPFRQELEKHLGTMIAESGDGELASHCLQEGQLKPGFLRPSSLRAAPALGAAILAIHALEGR